MKCIYSSPFCINYYFQCHTHKLLFFYFCTEETLRIKVERTVWSKKKWVSCCSFQIFLQIHQLRETIQYLSEKSLKRNKLTNIKHFTFVWNGMLIMHLFDKIILKKKLYSWYSTQYTCINMGTINSNNKLQWMII